MMAVSRTWISRQTAWLGQHLGWRSAYWAVVVIGALTVLAVLTVVPSLPGRSEATVRSELGSKAGAVRDGVPPEARSADERGRHEHRRRQTARDNLVDAKLHSARVCIVERDRGAGTSSGSVSPSVSSVCKRCCSSSG